MKEAMHITFASNPAEGVTSMHVTPEEGPRITVQVYDQQVLFFREGLPFTPSKNDLVDLVREFVEFVTRADQ